MLKVFSKMGNIIKRTVRKKNFQRILMIQIMTIEILMIYRVFQRILMEMLMIACTMIEILMKYTIIQRTLMIHKGFETVLMIACITLIKEICACAMPV